jgi:hypothetical protein
MMNGEVVDNYLGKATRDSSGTKSICVCTPVLKQQKTLHLCFHRG